VPLWLQGLLFIAGFFGLAFLAYRAFDSLRLAVVLLLGTVALCVLLVLEGAGYRAAGWASLFLLVGLAIARVAFEFANWRD